MEDDDAASSLPNLGPLALSGDKFAVGGLTPKTVNVDDVFADSGDGYFEKALPFGCLEKDTFFLG